MNIRVVKPEKQLRFDNLDAGDLFRFAGEAGVLMKLFHGHGQFCTLGGVIFSLQSTERSGDDAVEFLGRFETTNEEGIGTTEE